MRTTRLLTLLVAVAVVRPAFAQPAADKAPGEDEALYSCHRHTGSVAVTFKPETELKDLITWVMGFTCKNFILDPRIVSTGKKVTVIAPVKMSQHDAYRVFLVALSTMGLTVVPKGNVLRIVEASTAKSETVPIMKSGVPADDDQMVRYVLRPSYAPVETLRSALDSIRSQAGSVQVAGNMLIITDYASQVRDMMSLAKMIDVPGNNEGIYTIPVKYADATQLQQKLSEILGVSNTPGGEPGPGGPVRNNFNYRGRGPVTKGGAPEGGAETEETGIPSKILVDERTNTLIVVGSEPAYARVKSLVDRLDIVLDTEGGSAIRVYPLQNALAKDLAKTLNAALQGAGQHQGAPGRPGAPPIPPPGGATAGLDSLEGQVRVVSDDPTNSLIIMSSGRDYLAIRDVIRRLDQPRRQIFIEALILEVQLSKETDLGTSSHGGLPVDNGNALVLGGVQSANGPKSLNPASLATLSGLIGGLVGSPLSQSQTFLGTSIPSYAVLFQALANQANTNILSAPHIIAIDNEEAKFSVGNNIPYQAGLSFGGLGGLPGTTGTTGTTPGLPIGAIGQNIQRESLNLELNVTPHISSNDSVRLEIEQNTKDIGDKDPQLGPTWTERKLKTQVVVHDQETVVIGGLIQEREIYNTSKVPLLGDIPILGYLFKYTTKSKKKTNLLIMLTPYIIKDQLDLEAIRERKEREYHEFTSSFAYLNEAKYEPHIDYRRKRGLIEEINRAIEAVEEDKAEKAALDAASHHVQEGPVDDAPSTIEAPDDSGHGDGTASPHGGGH